MLERLIHEHVVSGAQLVGGTIALALHARRCGPAALADSAGLLADLEALTLGEIVGFDKSKMARLCGWRTWRLRSRRPIDPIRVEVPALIVRTNPLRQRIDRIQSIAGSH